MKKKTLEQQLEGLWKVAKKDWDRISKDTVSLIRKGEVYIKDKSEEGKKALTIMAFSLQREKLYYELGKTVAKAPKKRKKTSKKVLSLLSQIKRVSLNIKKTEKK